MINPQRNASVSVAEFVRIPPSSQQRVSRLTKQTSPKETERSTKQRSIISLIFRSFFRFFRPRATPHTLFRTTTRSHRGQPAACQQVDQSRPGEKNGRDQKEQPSIISLFFSSSFVSFGLEQLRIRCSDTTTNLIVASQQRVSRLTKARPAERNGRDQKRTTFNHLPILRPLSFLRLSHQFKTNCTNPAICWRQQVVLKRKVIHAGCLFSTKTSCGIELQSGVHF